MCDEVSGDATAGALRNGVVIRNIFKYLSTSSLLTCSCVSQLWRNEARSFIRDLREWTINVGYKDERNLWDSLFELDQVLGEMSSVIPFNSLRIFISKENVECEKEAKVIASLSNLTTKFPLKFLSVYEEVSLESYSGPAVSTLLELVHLNSSVLLELEILSKSSPNGIFKDWEPPEKFENLKKLSIARESSVAPECARKIILGAPNLRAIHNNCLPMIRHNVIPENMYGKLKRLDIALEDIDLVEKLADKLFHMEELILDQSGNWLRRNLAGDALKRRFIRLCQKVLALNASTLCNLNMRFEDNFLLSQLKFPILPSLRTLYFAVYKISEDLDQILSINFPQSFPGLRKVHIRQEDPRDQYANNGDMVSDGVIASQTTLELDIEHIILAEYAVALQRLFPSVITLSVTVYAIIDPLAMPARLGVVANIWPNLRSLHIRTTVSFGLEKVGPEILGLHPEELELLSSEDKEFLKRVQVPPNRPCVGTLKELEYFKLEYVESEDPGCVETLLELVETLLIGRRPGLNFKMERENFRGTDRFEDFTESYSYEPAEDVDSDDSLESSSDDHNDSSDE